MPVEARTSSPILVDLVIPQRKVAQNIVLVIIFSVLIALSAQLSFPLPFSPVPITMQTFMVLLAGVVLGSRLGAITLITYLCQGAAGMPVFAGGKAGILALFGPTGGYLFGFFVAAWLVGFLAERGWDKRIWTAALAMVLGNLVIYVLGVGWLANVLGFSKAITAGMTPFLLGDAAKIILAAVILPRAWSLFGRR